MSLVNLALLIDFSNFAVAVAICFRNERCARDSVHVRRTIIAIVDRPCTQFPRFSPFFFFFSLICDQRISSLDLSFSGHRARRRKTEEARQTVTKRAATNGFSSFGFCLGPKNGKSLLLLYHCARFSNTQYMLYRFGQFACWPNVDGQSSWANRDFALVLRLINNGLNQSCVVIFAFLKQSYE